MVAQQNNAKVSQSRNFAFLAEVDGTLVVYATRAERYIFDDPNTSLLKTRQFCERLGRHIAALSGLEMTENRFADTLSALRDRRIITGRIAARFWELWCWGNKANHSDMEDVQTAWKALFTARDLAVWFFRTFRNSKFQPGPYRPPVSAA